MILGYQINKIKFLLKKTCSTATSWCCGPAELFEKPSINFWVEFGDWSDEGDNEEELIRKSCKVNFSFKMLLWNYRKWMWRFEIEYLQWDYTSSQDYNNAISANEVFSNFYGPVFFWKFIIDFVREISWIPFICATFIISEQMEEMALRFQYANRFAICSNYRLKIAVFLRCSRAICMLFWFLWLLAF